MKLLTGLSDIGADYDAILCDVWGVLHNGRSAFASACEAIAQFKASRGPVVLITNAPVPKARVTGLFPKLGVPTDCFDDVVTSGDATRHELLIHAPGPVYRIGLKEDMSVYQGLDLDFTDDPDAARIVCCTSLRDFPDGEPEPYRAELKGLAKRGLPMICANPDLQFRHGDRLIWSAGALAAIYEEEGGTVIRPGKPDEPIYAVARGRVDALAGRPIAPARILAIGDGPATDVLGASRQGMDALFIGGGIHGHKLADPSRFIADATKLLAAAGVEARYAMSELAWDAQK